MSEYEDELTPNSELISTKNERIKQLEQESQKLKDDIETAKVKLKIMRKAVEALSDMINSQQTIIDSLIYEYCPDEMTEE